MVPGGSYRDSHDVGHWKGYRGKGRMEGFPGGFLWRVSPGGGPLEGYSGWCPLEGSSGAGPLHGVPRRELSRGFSKGRSHRETAVEGVPSWYSSGRMSPGGGPLQGVPLRRFLQGSPMKGYQLRRSPVVVVWRGSRGWITLYGVTCWGPLEWSCGAGSLEGIRW